MKRLTQNSWSVFPGTETVLIETRGVVFCAFIVFFLLQSSSVRAQPCSDVGGWVVSLEGSITAEGLPAQMGDQICSGAEIIVGQQSRAAIRLSSTQTVVRAQQNSVFVVEPSNTDRSFLKLLKGVLYFFSRRPQVLRVETPYVNAAIDGTEFVVDTASEGSKVTVIEGHVRVGNASGVERVNPGEVASAGSSGALRRRAVIDPLDAVQWALYYPPIGAVENTSSAVQLAAEMLARGDVEKAEVTLDSATGDAAAFALQAMIAVTRNQVSDALQLAQKAVDLDPESSLAYSALSYAQQTQFKIDQALLSATIAVRNDPGNADALARLAELQLGVDETSQALASANEAVRLDGNNSRARTILGFVHLVRLDVGKAQETFSDAITLEPGDPLPRLGLGLAVIRDGRLIEGREHIEVAASLDPANALVRSYLGKAYFEERQTGDAGAQFALAQRLDPRDPTPWFYDALLDQALNRPVSAFKKINRARELNDNRLIYQSRLLVDKSAAAGSLSLSRIYTDLGFEQPAINESTRSIAVDPTNYSAYRFLADSYSDRERHQSARRIVLFQASLLQPMTINPVQPYAQESDLLILPGSNPVHPSINEYSPLFDRQGIQLAGSLIAGDEDTLGDNLVLSGLQDRFVYSLGQFHYENDGFRVNNDVEHDIYHGFIQAQALPNLYLQAEYRKRETERGDLALNFNSDSFSQNLRVNAETKSPRLGLRAELNQRSTLLLSAEAIESSERSTEFVEPFFQNAKVDVDGYQGSARFIYHSANVSQAAGLDSYDINIDNSAVFIMPDGGLIPGNLPDGYSQYTSFHYYADFFATPVLQWTLGLNYSNLKDRLLRVDENSIDPRLGVRWKLRDDAEVRFALSRGRKLNRIADKTLEPTNLAGFNQIYDDVVGTRYMNVGVALDTYTDTATRSGIELLYRKLDVPNLLQLDFQSTEFAAIIEEQHETTFRAYWNRILNSSLSFGIEMLYERFERDDVFDNEGNSLINEPLNVETFTFPIFIGYTSPSGFFAQGELDLVHQTVESNGEDTRTVSESEQFTNVNASVGLRLPSLRLLRATFRFDVYNLLDATFNFQDHNIQSRQISSPRFSPGRSFVGRVSFSFL